MRALAGALLAGLLAAAAGCGSEGATTPTAPYVITILADRFDPVHLAVPPGATVVVLNRDADPHTVTSAAAQGTFTPGGVDGVQFDTGPIAPGGAGAFTLSASATVGAVVPYYDAILQGAMLDQADLTVVAP